MQGSLVPLILSVITTSVGILLTRFILRRQFTRVLEEKRLVQQDLDQERINRAETEAAAAARQQALFENMVEGVLLLNKEGQVQFTNSACRRFFGLQTDLRGHTLLETFRSHAIADVAAEVASQGRVTGRVLELTLAPEPRSIQINAVAIITPDGRRSGALMVFHDTTRLRQLESTRREFVANVSHELRTPLSLIKGSVETLLDGASKDPKASARFLEIIDRHCDRLTFLIEDLLTLSRLESGQIALNFDTVPLRNQADGVLDDFTRKAADRSVTLSNTIPEELCARADSDRLDQVLFNLLDNAIKYGRPGGNVRINGRKLPETNLIEISVSDDGPGIPTDAAERVFERFYRVDTARSREQGGTGLGLSIVKHIIQAHGGEVKLETTLGKGTIFRLTLPIAEEVVGIS